MHVKICGLQEPVTLNAAVAGGARYVGFVFVEKSPRYIPVNDAAPLAHSVPPGVCKVALLVNPDDAAIDAVTKAMPVDMLQLHGTEPPERVKDIRTRTGLPVMKAVGVADAGDLTAVADYAKVADQILIDAKPPKDAVVPGGNGLTIDWQVLAGCRWPLPWMLSGGLDAQNVAEAVAVTGAVQVDLSSGVEVRRGVKDASLIRQFLDVAR